MRRKTLIRQAADGLLKDATTTVSIVGHSDTTGSTAQKQATADARAKAVNDQLVLDKVPAMRISSAKGDPAAMPQSRVAMIQVDKPTAAQRHISDR